jgi:8-oxo-dGTP diphosphatase
MKITEFDWENWEPMEKAVLCLIIEDNRILLIRKKKGLGAGKINGPGGRIEPGEKAIDAAVRETEEEVGLTPINVQRKAVLSFVFTDGFSIYVEVFTASACRGNMIETDEATPYWFRLDEIPYHEMWDDDSHWLPLILEGKNVNARFIYEEERILDQDINIL